MPIAFSRTTTICRHLSASVIHFIAVWLLFCFFILPLQLQARAVIYDGRDGLNSNDIICLAKGSRGLIWIGTFNGLNIFDGYTFTKFQGPLSDKSITSLKNSLFTDELLVGTSIGFFRVNEKTLKVQKLTDEGRSTEASISPTQSICINQKDKQIYFATKNGYIARVKDGTSFSVISRLAQSVTGIRDLIVLDAGHLIVDDGALHLVNVATGVITPLTYSDKKVSKIQSVTAYGNNLLFCDDNLMAYTANIPDIDLQRGFIPVSAACRLPDKPVKTVVKDNKLYCLGENYNFIRFDLKTKEQDNLSQKYPAVFEGKVFHSLSIDENDIIWIGTNKGVIKVDEHSIRFDKELSNIPIRISTREIYETGNGDLYVCSYAGLWHLPHGTTEWIRHGERKTSPSLQKNEYKGYIQPVSLLYNPSGDFFYIGTDGSSIFKFDISHKYFENLNMKIVDTGGTLSGIPDMEQDKTGKIWMATVKGLGFYDPQTNTLTMQRKGRFNIGSLRIRQLYYDKAADLMYIATVKGLYIVDINKGITGHYSAGSVPALSNNDILCVTKDNHNNIWLGTNGGGVNVISGNQVKYIRRQDGLSSEVVYNMMQESDNIFWFGTFNGLDRYQRDKNAFFNFFEEDGLSSNEFNQNSFLRTKDNRFYLGSINGLTTFRPQQFSAPVPFRIYFAGISKWDEQTQSIRLFMQYPETGSTIEKGSSDQLVELHFGCSDYSDPQRNAYSYRIREISDNWISLEERHTLNIGGLPYGDYTLEVKATNSRGGASSNILFYNLHIQQPFYRTWWFFVLTLAIACLLFYGAYLIKYQNFKRILHLRMKIASNLHDEVGSLLTRITMFSENLRYSKNNEEQRNVKLEKIALLSREAVASMSDVLWTIDSRNDFAGNLLDRMREHAEEMLFPLGIDVNFVLDVNDLKKHIDSDTRGEIYLIFKEAINNIAKHSNATHVEIFYRFNDKHLHLKISNNGVKESISDISTGQGLDNMKMRAGKIGATISAEKTGGHFIVELITE